MSGTELAEIALTIENCIVCKDLPQYCDACKEEINSLVDNCDECPCDGAYIP